MTIILIDGANKAQTMGSSSLTHCYIFYLLLVCQPLTIALSAGLTPPHQLWLSQTIHPDHMQILHANGVVWRDIESMM